MDQTVFSALFFGVVATLVILWLWISYIGEPIMLLWRILRGRYVCVHCGRVLRVRDFKGRANPCVELTDKLIPRVKPGTFISADEAWDRVFDEMGQENNDPPIICSQDVREIFPATYKRIREQQRRWRGG